MVFRSGKKADMHVAEVTPDAKEQRLLQDVVHPLFADLPEVRLSWSFFGHKSNRPDENYAQQQLQKPSGPVRLSISSTVVVLGTRLAEDLHLLGVKERSRGIVERVVNLPWPQPPEVVLAALSFAMYLANTEEPFSLLLQVPRRSDRKGIRLAWKDWQRRARLDLEDSPCLALRAKSDGYRWLKEDTEESSYLERLAGAFATLRQAVYLPSVEAMVRGTRLLSPMCRRPSPQCTLTAMWHCHSPVYEVACRRARQGFRVVAVNAASALSVGGSFLSGGRHGLEEMLCMQSTLHFSLQRAAQLAAERQLRDSQGNPVHIPDDGVVLSPGVEFFRSGAEEGYALFAEGGVRLEAVISVAMPSANKAQRELLIERKLHAVLQAAASVDAEVLVIPDIGCGVHGHDAAMMGSVFGRVLYGYPSFFTEVIICGRSEFFSAACEAAGSRYNLMCRQPLELPEKIKAIGRASIREGQSYSPAASLEDGQKRGVASLPCGCAQGLCALSRSFIERVRDI